jgi:YD repeat-containing protein
MKKVKIGLLSMLLSIGTVTEAQHATELAMPPLFVPPSPTASSLALFADYPVSHYTGIPDISIPIYEISIDNFKMPITLKYHSSGIRISQEASWVGLGWALDVGGSISRTVKAFDDFAKYPYGSVGNFKKGYYYSPNSYYHMDYYQEPLPFKLEAENEPDIFYFSLPFASGKFLIDKSDGPILFDKSSGIKIEVNENTNPAENYFTITATDGTKYIFDKKEVSETASAGGKLRYGEYNGMSNGTDFSEYRTYVSTWLLSKIVLVNKKEILFSYTYERYKSPGQESCLKYNNLGYMGNPCTIPLPGVYYFSSKQTVEGFRLTQISWDNGHIDFSASERDDMKDESAKKLDEIKIYNNIGTFFKKYTFDYDYFDHPQNPGGNKDYIYKRLKLSQLYESDAGSYTFSYHAGNLPAKNDINSDYWGFYNGQNYGDDYYTRAYRGTQLYQGALKESNYTYMLMGSLKKIVFPTGGYAEFDYEMNTFDYTGLKYVLGDTHASGAKKEGGGLRILQIKTGSDNTATKYRKFKYFGGKVIKPLCLTYEKEFDDYCDDNCSGWATYFVQTSASMTPLTAFNKGNIVGYNRVEESLTEGNKTSYTNYFFHNYIEDDEEEGNAVLPYVSRTINYYNGLPTSVSYGYTDLNTNTNYVTKTISYEYEGTTIKTINAFYVQLNAEYRAYIFGWGKPVCAFYDSRPFYYDYNFMWVRKISETTRTAKETNGVSSLTGSNSIEEITLYQDYDTLNVRPKTIWKENRLKVFYPQDFTDNISQGMVAKHMIETPVETITINQGKVISGEKITYKYESVPGMYVPETAYILKFPAGVTMTESNYRDYFVPKLYYDAYNSKGKVLQLRTDKETTVYLWSYKNQYPIAEIKNATYAQVKNAITGGEYFITQLADKAEPSSADYTTINNIHTALPNTLITVYTYKPLVGMLKATDPRGITTYYDYDSDGRLKETYIKENGTGAKKILQQYDYHYKH